MAATPVDPRVAERQTALMLALPANAHSEEHAQGRAAAKAIEQAAGEVAAFAGRPPASILFTPGASAALWLAIEDFLARAPAGRARILLSAAEHPSLLAHARRAATSARAVLEIINVDAVGAPRVDALAEALASGAGRTADLVCAMAANNEVGTITRMAPIVELVREAGARLLVDASQAAGRCPMSDFAEADYLILSGAKIYGPRRVGVLAGALGKEARGLAETVFGSPDAAGAAAMALACALRGAEGAADEARIAAMRDRLEAHLRAAVPGLAVNGDIGSRLAGSLHVSAPDMPGDAVVARLWGDVSLSTGAACQSGVPGPSHVLAAIGGPAWIADGAVRIGIGRFNSMEDIDAAAPLIAEAMALMAHRRRA